MEENGIQDKNYSDDNEKDINLIQNTRSNSSQSNNRTWLQRTFGKMGPGSLRGSIFNICILSLGTGLLAIPQKVGYMSVLLSPFIIVLGGIANLWSLSLLVDMCIKYKVSNYENVVEKLLGHSASVFLGLTMCLNQVGTIILYQVILYKLIGGVINEFGKYGYNSIEDFAKNSFWNKLWLKFVVCYGILIFILLPLCLLKDASKMRYASTFGILSLFFLIIIIVFESPFYIKKIIIDEKQKLNYYNILKELKGDMNFLQSLVTVLYAFSCHVGTFPVLITLHNRTKRRQQKVLRRAMTIDTICFLIVGACGYLTQPLETPDLIIERKKIFDNDWIMTIGVIGFIVTLFAKISANYNGLRSCILVLLHYEIINFPKKINFAITLIVLITTTFISSVFQSISDYFSLMGSFCTVIICYYIPGLVYIKGNDYPLTHYKNIITVIFITLILALGLLSGFFTIKGIVS